MVLCKFVVLTNTLCMVAYIQNVVLVMSVWATYWEMSHPQAWSNHPLGWQGSYQPPARWRPWGPSSPQALLPARRSSTQADPSAHSSGVNLVPLPPRNKCRVKTGSKICCFLFWLTWPLTCKGVGQVYRVFCMTVWRCFIKCSGPTDQPS